MEILNKQLLDKLQKSGRIKDVSEAFKEFPVEEEWHKGNIDSFVKENIEQYGEYSIGDIVFVDKYKYSNGKMGERHLFVIIERDNYAVPIEYFSMILSSHIEKLKYNSNKLLLKDELNNLRRDSIVKTDVIYKIKQDNIKYKVGRVRRSVVENYMRNLEKLF